MGDIGPTCNLQLEKVHCFDAETDSLCLAGKTHADTETFDDAEFIKSDAMQGAQLSGVTVRILPLRPPL